MCLTCVRSQSTYKLAVLIDNEQLTTHTSARAEVGDTHACGILRVEGSIVC